MDRKTETQVAKPTTAVVKSVDVKQAGIANSAKFFNKS
jgi:hypothetical protein